jgi:hypothetical protein
MRVAALSAICRAGDVKGEQQSISLSVIADLFVDVVDSPLAVFLPAAWWSGDAV